MEETIMIFIDASNLYFGALRFDKQFRLDYLKLVKELVRDRRLIRPYYFGSFNTFNPKTHDKQKKFHTFLETNGFDVIAKPLRRRGNNLIEKGIDISMGVSMVVKALNKQYDTAVLVSGDDDLVDAVEEVKRAGSRVEVAMFSKNIGAKLRNSADECILLDDIADKIRKAKYLNIEEH